MIRLIGRAIKGFLTIFVVIGFVLTLALMRSGYESTADTRPAERETGGTVEVNEDSTLDAWVSAWAADVYPDYYRVVGVCTSDDPTAPDGIAYGELDELGRATGAAGWITGAMRAEARGQDRDEAPEMDDPAGWPSDNPKVTIVGAKGRRDYTGYLWNRSHLVAFSLGGDMAAHNLVAGTRTENVGDNTAEHPGGMAYTETLARTWLDDHPEGRLWYAATPVYEGEDPIPRAVIVDIKSDDGAIDQKVCVFNRANGFSIDYATGEAEPVDPIR